MLGCISGQSLQLGCSRGFHEGARNSGSRATHRISIAAEHQPSRSLGPQVLSQRHPFTSGSIRRSTRRSVSAAAWFNQQSAEAKIEQTAQLTQEDDTLEVLRLAPEVRERVTTAVEDLGGTVRGALSRVNVFKLKRICWCAELIACTVVLLPRNAVAQQLPHFSAACHSVSA